jgi:predicted DNA repair protein MutK
VVGLSPDRELPIIWKIALGSLKNKLLFLLPAALALSALAPWAIVPLLMIGGAYLCYEACEKIVDALSSGHHHADEVLEIADPKALEDRQIGGAIRTDFILSAEIMAIALADLPELSLGTRAFALAIVGLAITIGVYGVVALIVKMDDIGLHLAGRSVGAVRKVGRGLVKAMPALLKALSTIGTAAMVWVGGGIIVHGLEEFGLETVPHWVHGAAEAAAHAMPGAAGIASWIVTAFGSAVVGLIVGGVIVALLHFRPGRRGHADKAAAQA